MTDGGAHLTVCRIGDSRKSYPHGIANGFACKQGRSEADLQGKANGQAHNHLCNNH